VADIAEASICLALRGRRFSSNEEIIGMVQNWIKTQPTFFSDN
jgi:hypothetical protein